MNPGRTQTRARSRRDWKSAPSWLAAASSQNIPTRRRRSLRDGGEGRFFALGKDFALTVA
jgi:hypothetical protein